jgi:hypothetical protein
MPFWNRPAELTRSLEAYARTYPDMQFEFVIADDGSMFKPVLPRAWYHPIKVITLPRKVAAKNPCVPINAAIRAASSNVIVLTNPEIEHTERVLDKMYAALVSENDYVMTGCRDSSGAWYAGPEAPRAPVGGRQPIPPGTELHFCVLFHRSLFERVGGFDEEYRELPGCDDNDFLWKLWALGDVKFKYVPGVVTHHKTARGKWTGSLEKSFARLRSKWGHLPEYQQCAS